MRMRSERTKRARHTSRCRPTVAIAAMQPSALYFRQSKSRIPQEEAPMIDPAQVRNARSAACAVAAAVTGALALPGAALASATWDGLKTEVYGARPILPGAGIVTLKAPSRPEDQRAVPISVDADFRDGRTVKAVTFVVDENPSPIAAAFNFQQPREHVTLA